MSESSSKHMIQREREAGTIVWRSIPFSPRFLHFGSSVKWWIQFATLPVHTPFPQVPPGPVSERKVISDKCHYNSSIIIVFPSLIWEPFAQCLSIRGNVRRDEAARDLLPMEANKCTWTWGMHVYLLQKTLTIYASLYWTLNICGTPFWLLFRNYLI